MDFNKIVKDALASTGMSQNELAAELGVTPQYLSYLLNNKNKKRWNKDLMDKACKTLGIRIEFKKEELDNSDSKYTKSGADNDGKHIAGSATKQIQKV